MGNLTLTPHELATGTSMSVRACIMGRRRKRRRCSDALASSALAAPVEDAINISPVLARKQLSFGHYLFIAKIGQISLYIYKFKYL